MSLDAKATVKVGEFSRNGKSRVVTQALDHDFQPDETITPYSILLPDYDRIYLYFTTGRVTSDFIADCIANCWQPMLWNDNFPVVQLVHGLYDTGKKLTQKAMTLLEQRFERDAGLGKWFVKIQPLPLFSS